MEKLKIRYIVAVVIILVGAVLVNAVEYETFNKFEDAVRTINKIPIKVGNWQGSDVALEENIFEILETRSIIHRSYHKGKQRVFLSLVYYPETKVDFHAPEACLGGQGRKVSKSSTAINILNGTKNISLELNKLVYIDGLNDELVYYFYKAGDFMGKSYIQLRFSLALNKMAGEGTSGALIRFSTPSRTIDNVSGKQRLTQFIQEMYPYLVKYL